MPTRAKWSPQIGPENSRVEMPERQGAFQETQKKSAPLQLRGMERGPGGEYIPDEEPAAPAKDVR